MSPTQKRIRFFGYGFLAIVLVTTCANLSGCASAPEVMTAEQIITEKPEKKSRACVKAEDLPACPGDRVRYIEYRAMGCVWTTTCVSRF